VYSLNLSGVFFPRKTATKQEYGLFLQWLWCGEYNANPAGGKWCVLGMKTRTPYTHVRMSIHVKECVNTYGVRSTEVMCTWYENA